MVAVVVVVVVAILHFILPKVVMYSTMRIIITLILYHIMTIQITGGNNFITLIVHINERKFVDN